MANPVDILIEKKAFQQLEQLSSGIIKAQEELLRLGNIALSTSNNISKINTPSGVTANSNNAQNITANLNQQTESLRKLETQKLKVAKATAEETVNQGILNRNAKQAVLANSQLAGAYANLSAQQSKASRTLQDLIVRGKTATQTQRQYNLELKKARVDFDLLNKKVLTADKAVGRFNRNVGNYPQVTRGFSELLGAFGIIGGIGIIASITKDIFNQTRELQSLDLALKQVIGTQDEYVQAQNFLLRVSEQYGVGIKELTKSYTQFYVSAKDKLSGQEIEGIFESVSKAAGAMGLSVEQQEGAFLALTQMLSKGTVQAEELRGQLSERLPGSFGILAKSMGVTEKVLGDMLKQGQVMASEVLPKFAKELEKAYGIENLKRVESLNASTTRLSNSWTGFIKSLNEGSGAFSKFLQVGIDNVTFLINATSLLLTSNEKLRKSYLNGQKEQGYNSAKEILAQFKTADERESYANEALVKTRAEIAKNTAEFNRLKNENLQLSTVQTQAYTEEAFLNNKTIKQNEEKIKSLNNLIFKQVGYVNGLKAILAEENKLNEKSEETEQQRNERLRKEDEIQRQIFTNRKKELQLELQVIDQTLNDEQMFYQERLVALELHRLKRLEILTLQYNEDVRLSKGNQLKQKEALIDYHSETLTEIENFNKKKNEIQGVTPEGLVDTAPDAQKQLQESADKATLSLEKENESIKRQIEQLKLLKNATDEYIKSFSDSFLSDIGLGSMQKFFDGTFEKLMLGADTMEKKFAVTFLAIADVAKEAFAFISQASQQNFEAEYARLEMQKSVAIKFAGESTVAQEQINLEYDRRRKEIQRREAESKKDLAVFNSIINTAQGVTSALANANIPLAIVIGALGAIQTGFIASQEIPQFFEGGVHDGGLMLVNDGKGSNYRETIVTPDGKVINPTSRNVLMNAPKGTQIFNANQTAERDAYLQTLLQQRGISMNFKPKESGISSNDFNSGISRLERTMSKSSNGRITADRRGISLWKEENGRKTKVLNNRLYVR